jgi:S1-C subfamily serine protease
MSEPSTQSPEPHDSSSSSRGEPHPPGDLSAALEHAVERAGPSVVRLSSRHGHAASATVWSRDGLILTTHRAIRHAAKLIVADHDEREHEATLVGRDVGLDLALLRIASDVLPPIARVPADELPRVGALSVALGRPGWRIRASLRIVGLVGPRFRTSNGGRVDAWLESDRALPRGFGGGPLIDVAGRMLGLSSRALVRHADLALPCTTIERAVAELLEHGEIRHGWLGVSLVPIQLPGGPEHEARTAVLVAGVEADSPAARAGLLIGDVLLGLDGEPIEGPGALREALRGKAGVSLELSLSRAGQPLSVSAVPGEK